MYVNLLNKRVHRLYIVQHVYIGSVMHIARDKLYRSSLPFYDNKLNVIMFEGFLTAIMDYLETYLTG